ncbi:hypothetical protein HID58_017151 [Brassica napus]|uniref:Uncharacterized protein n=1 Tax=Brassica napus TaxID=3708 RepID=A0ABQ8D8S5_BRANA|nr:hypothetical protein HID58_017151 [Brassica napus]
MASSDAVLAHSAFDALRLRRSAQFIVGRLLRFWDSKNIKKQGEFMGITLLLLDEKVNGGDVTKLPQCFAELAGEEFVFHIRVTPCNFTANHCTFTLYEISSNLNLEVLYYILS